MILKLVQRWKKTYQFSYLYGTMVLIILYVALKYTGLWFESVNISIVVIMLINFLMFFAFILSITYVKAVYILYYNKKKWLPTQYLIGPQTAAPSSDRI